MKRLLLILMVFASVAMAGERTVNMAMAGDRQIKAFLTGTWTNNYDQTTAAFQSNGNLLWDVNKADYPGDPEKWDVEDGQLIEIRGGGKSDYSYTILFLTKHEFLALANRGDTRKYFFLKR